MRARAGITAFVLVVAVTVAAYLAFTLGNASYTLGCDYLTYDQAARRLVAGTSPFDLSITVTGTCGTYQYPPTFLALVLPFTLLDPSSATWAWIALSIAMVTAAFLVIPVPRPVRLMALLLAGTSWPLLFAIKVGAVAPLLILVFAVAWRWFDNPLRLALATAIGTLTKLQPALLVVWMLLTGRWRAVALTAAIGLGALLVTSLLVPGSIGDFLTVVRTLQGNAIALPANFAPASVALRAGFAEPAAQAFGIVHTVAVLLLVAIAARRSAPDASLLVAAVASQVVAPVMWDHYAAIVFLPIAWLLARGHTWAIVVGVLFNAMFVAIVPASIYVFVLDGTMIAVAVLGRVRADRGSGMAPLARGMDPS